MSGEVDSTWDHQGDFFDRKHPQTHQSLILEIRHLKKNNVENQCNLSDLHNTEFAGEISTALLL